MKPLNESLRSRVPDCALLLTESTPLSYGERKFVRVNSMIRVAAINGLKQPQHPDLILDLKVDVREIAAQDPSKVDAGTLMTNPDMKRIRIMGRSDSLNTPLPEHEKEAKEETARKLKALFPDFTIMFDENEGIPMEGDSGGEGISYIDLKNY